MSEVCWPCRRNQHDGCAALFTYDLCECTHEKVVAPTPVGDIGNALNLDTQEADTKTVVRRQKNDMAVTDPQSTGRKRAAKLYPLIDPNGNKLPCDFQNRKSCLPSYMEVQIDGCGVRTGTMPNFAQSRHHHDYNVMNNERENIGLLCLSCHNLLHAKNDPYKDKIYERIYGVKPDTADLKHANKALKSGVVGGGVVLSKEEVGLE